MTIDIICPLYNAIHYIESLHESLLMQQNVKINTIQYMVTRSNDGTEKWLDDHHIGYTLIEREDFSHSLTREKAVEKCDGDILVFITQDIKIVRADWLYKLVEDIQMDKCHASYSRQLCTGNSIEKYTREMNYPDKSFYKNKDSIENLGLNTFFFSNASSAILRSIFEELNGYDHKDLPSNEDMYFAYKLINANYIIKYCADSEVIHYHDLKFKELMKRYRDTGRFFKMEPQMKQYGTSSSGSRMALYILKRIIEEKNIKAAIQFIPNMAARLIGMKLG